MTQNIDLANLQIYKGFAIYGVITKDWSGYCVSAAGDVNNDGYDDIIIGALYSYPGSGTSYVIYGSSSPSNLDLANLGTRGFAIYGKGVDKYSDHSVSSAGDVNNDGYDDIIIGFSKADPNSRSGAGISYVVYGSSNSSDINLVNLGTRGFAIYGAAVGDFSGYSVSNAGDVNNDGYDDIIIGASMADPDSRSDAGTSYVIYGSSNSSDIDLVNLGTRGFAIYGAAALDSSGYSVSNAGDVNNDGYDDIIIGAFFANSKSKYGTGMSYVIYGSSISSNVDLANLGTRGFAIYGAIVNDFSGSSVSNAGDINNDGYDDIVIGAPGDTKPGSGKSYVIYGSSISSNVDLDNLGTRGFAIYGANSNDRIGLSVSSAGDINNDGYADIIIGAGYADSRTNAGTSYVIYGNSSLSDLDLVNLGTEGFAIYGAAAYNYRGSSASNAGDINNDGYDDIIIVASGGVDSNFRSQTGTLYVIYGSALPTIPSTSIQTSTHMLTKVIVITNGDSYGGSSVDENFIIDSSKDITITGGGGTDMYTLKPHAHVLITVTDFDKDADVIDLSSLNIHNFNELNITADSIINLENQQKISLLNLNHDDIDEINFIFAPATMIPTFTSTVQSEATSEGIFSEQSNGSTMSIADEGIKAVPYGDIKIIGAENEEVV